jgi:formylglycine-generating enzyme required for sulfatase activity
VHTDGLIRGVITRLRSVKPLLLIAGLTVSFDAAALWSGPPTIGVPAGPFLMGSTRAERDAAYALDEAAYGHARTRQARWYESEPPLHEEMTAAFAIMTVPVTNADYARFVGETGHRTPFVDGATWRGYGLVHPYSAVQRFLWDRGEPPPGRERHPVVLVSHADAEAYAAWLSRATGRHWRLPTEAEWEKAARGTDGRRFPWGEAFDPTRLASHDAGIFDTVPVGSHPTGASPFGMLDAAGLVFEWTATPQGPDRYVVKGGSWDDKGCGVCRPAARHARPADLKHILIGFRLVRDP